MGVITNVYIYENKTDITQRLMNTVNHNPGSESARVSDEKTSKCKAFARMKLSSDNVIDPLFL